MTADSAAALAHRFARQVDRLLAVRKSAESAFAIDALRRSDLDHIYESTFLDVVSYFEIFIEDLFFSSVTGRSAIDDVHPIILFSTRTQAEGVIGGTDRGYMTWSKMQDVVNRAESFLRDGRPFSRMRNRARDLEILSKGSKIRNAIAHRSESAREQFLRLPHSGLSPARRTPAGYLQQRVGSTTQHETFANAYVRIAKALTAPRHHAAEPFLQEEIPYDSGQRAPRGEYACLRCGIVTRSPGTRGKLSRCTCSMACIQCGQRRPSHFQRVP